MCPGADPRAVARDWLARGPALAVVTLGADGAYALTSQFAVTRVAPRITVVDTVGAGDAFTAGLLTAVGGVGLLGRSRREHSAAITRSGLDEVLDFAIAVASATCSSRGRSRPAALEVGGEPAFRAACWSRFLSGMHCCMHRCA
ncbi:PfkB family carbohydrate kinase [Nocardia sp. NPDC050630]|uniref:PfkB family carbohydrate kinase n=1 Tax=Nocardia sp. NPDC050630 TaxID=3364321 RepID=UPI0037BAE021